MDVNQILNRIPISRRSLLYISDNKAEKIDYSNNTFKNRLGNTVKSSENTLTIDLSDFGYTQEKILELIQEKKKIGTEEEPSEFKPSNDFYENETEDYFDDMEIKYPSNPDFNRPSYEWDRHTIFIDLPVKEYFDDCEYLKGDLFLSTNYRRMYPENRFRYLNWLIDTTKPIEKSYIYLYIECLERSGIEKNLEQVTEELLILKRSHTNISKAFDKKIDKTIALICFYLKRNDILSDLYSKGKIDEISSPIIYHHFTNKIGLQSRDVLSIFKRLRFKLTIIKGFEDLFLEALTEIFKTRFSSHTFPVFDYCIMENAPSINEKFSNWNLNADIGEIEIPELWFEETFNNELFEIYNLSCERFKVLKKNRKK